MNENLRAAQRTRVEFEQTQAAWDIVRQAMVDKLLSTPIDAQNAILVRERLYLGVQVLDAVRKAMMDAISTAEIEEYAAALRNGAEEV